VEDTYTVEQRAIDQANIDAEEGPEIIRKEDFKTYPRDIPDPSEIVVAETEVTVDGQDLKRHNVFNTDSDPNWNWDKEIDYRIWCDGKKPYVITREEFFNKEAEGFEQWTLTYYEGDNILTDQDDKPIYNHEDVTGEMEFGKGSGDINVFYVRNEELEAEYEIVRDHGKYSDLVLGEEIEEDAIREDLRHTGAPRFRLTEE
jgi:hypothetical protein